MHALLPLFDGGNFRASSSEKYHPGGSLLPNDSLTPLVKLLLSPEPCV